MTSTCAGASSSTLFLQLLLLLSLPPSSSSDATPWALQLLTDPRALSLDASPGSFYIRPGQGANASKFVLFQQAGGWAMSPADLLFRSRTAC